MRTAPKRNKITEKLAPLILEQAANGMSARAISEWLKAEHGVVASHVCVSRWLKKRRTERADVAKVVVREQLAKTLTSDIARLERFAKKAVRLANANEHDAFAWAKLADQVRKFTEAKLKAAGVDEPDGEAAERTLAGLFAELERR